MRTRAPSAMPSRAASRGFTRSRGAPSRFREPGVSVKLVLRKLRAGGVIRRKGVSGPAHSSFRQ